MKVYGFGRTFSASPVRKENVDGFELTSPVVYVADKTESWKNEDQRFWCPKHIFEKFYKTVKL